MFLSVPGVVSTLQSKSNTRATCLQCLFALHDSQAASLNGFHYRLIVTTSTELLHVLSSDPISSTSSFTCAL